MKTFFIFLISVLFCTSMLFAVQNNSDNAVQDQIKLTKLWITEIMDYYRIPGLAAGIIDGDSLVWAKGFGYANLESRKKVIPTTLFRMASVTKLFTSTAIMQLRDAGKLKLDDPVAKYLDWFELKSDFKNAPPVTIRHLLTHTSGIPRESAFPYWTDHKFPTREEMIRALKDQKAVFYPETKWKYSNL